MLLCIENKAIQNLLVCDLDITCFLEESQSLAEFDASHFPTIYFIEFLKQLLELVIRR